MNTIRIPFIKSDRAAFGIVFLVGLGLCAVGGIGHAAARGWFDPVSILGYILGTLAMLLGLSVLFRIRVGPIQNDRAALFALAGIIAAKLVVSLFYSLV
jgi:hypothetical protein